MNITIQVNIGLTDQLAGFLTKLVGGVTTPQAEPAPKAAKVATPDAEDPAEPDVVTEEKPAKTKGKAKATPLMGDQFSQDIKTANAEVAEESKKLAEQAPAYTTKDLLDAAGPAMAKIGADGMKAVLSEYKDKDGNPVTRLANLQVTDYGEIIGKFNAKAA